MVWSPISSIILLLRATIQPRNSQDTATQGLARLYWTRRFGGRLDGRRREALNVRLVFINDAVDVDEMTGFMAATSKSAVWISGGRMETFEQTTKTRRPARVEG